MNTKRLSEETHKDELYKNTENGEIIIFWTEHLDLENKALKIVYCCNTWWYL
jgi:hypothetical protein